MYLGLASLLGFGSLMWFLASLSGDVSSTALDEVAGSVSLALSEEPPQLDSSRATDTVSGEILGHVMEGLLRYDEFCLLYTSPSPRDGLLSRMPSSA